MVDRRDDSGKRKRKKSGSDRRRSRSVGGSRTSSRERSEERRREEDRRRDEADGWTVKGAEKERKRREKEEKKRKKTTSDRRNVEVPRHNKKHNQAVAPSGHRTVVPRHTGMTLTQRGLQLAAPRPQQAPKSTKEAPKSSTPKKEEAPPAIVEQQQQVPQKPLYSSVASETGETVDRSKFFLQVVRKDNNTFSKLDQSQIQFGVASGLLEAVKAGIPMQQMCHHGCAKQEDHLRVFTNPDSGKFFQNLINKVDPEKYVAYLPGERPTGHIIMAYLPSEGKVLLEDLPLYFSIGTGGWVKPEQVRVYKKPVVTKGSVSITLQVDQKAFDYLKQHVWMSNLALYVV